MAYFDCTIGSAGEFSIPLVVTCTANFAGQTITCSDGTTTLTGTCPSASPYEVEFELPNTGTWTVSGTISGHTYSNSVLVNEFDIELLDSVDITVDVYSAVNDTISYVAFDGQTHTITTDSSGHASATITVYSSGTTNITFNSSVALDVENGDLSTNYSKTISLNTNTTEIKIMPDTAYTWFGNECIWNSGGWAVAKFNSGHTGSYVVDDYALKAYSGNDWMTFGIKKKRNYNLGDKMTLLYKGPASTYVLTTVSPTVARGWDAQATIMLADGHYPSKSSYGIFSESLTSNMAASDQYWQIKFPNSPLYLRALLIES